MSKLKISKKVFWNWNLDMLTLRKSCLKIFLFGMLVRKSSDLKSISSVLRALVLNPDDAYARSKSFSHHDDLSLWCLFDMTWGPQKPPSRFQIINTLDDCKIGRLFWNLFSVLNYFSFLHRKNW